MTAPDMTDWRLARTGAGPAGLEPYEAVLLDGLFGGSQQVRVADLKGKLGTTLSRSRRQLTHDMVERGWIASGRGGKIALFAVAGGVLLVAGLVLIPILGAAFAGAWIGTAVAFVGLVWICTCAVMVRRPRREVELRQRAASYRAYVRRGGGRTEALGASLPYAIAFGADRAWRADDGGAGASLAWFGAGSLFWFWYFEDAMDDTISYIPPSTSSGGWSGGSSGFDGGSAGGGDGGGGGGSW